MTGDLDSSRILASALLWLEQFPDADFVFATHDRALGKAAKIMGLREIGTE